MKHWQKILLGLSLPAAILLAWWLATTYGDIPPQILPKPQSVLAVYGGEDASVLLGHLLISLWRVVQGFLLASLLGVVFGSLTGVSRVAKSILMPTLTAIRQIPMIAWIPLLILWCGIGEASKIAIIVLAAFFCVFVNTHAGIAETPENFLEVARLYRLSKLRTFFGVHLPSALPQILTGLQLGLGVSWMAVVASELISATSGIGYHMSDARVFMRSDIVIACMLVIGLVGIAMNTALALLFGLIAPWKPKGAHK
ncbi:MAG: ABC transporter permease [Oscillospiraceae bacterium]|jgi:sulfonate transport system permease protein|nr:ABC transporter permease [Oscillospiraceae bacterium]